MQNPHLRRWTVASAAVLATSLALTGCSQGAAQGGDDKVFTVWWFDTPESAMGAAAAHALDEFKKAHPDVEVVFEQKSFEQMQQSGTMVINSDSAPDVLEFPKGTATAGLAAKSGLLLDVSDVASKRGWDEKIPASVMAVGRYDERGVMGVGPIYGIPNYGEFVGVYYNKDMFAQHGLEIPTTMDEFEKVMDAFVAEGITPLAMAGAEYGANHLWYELALAKADREWIDDFQSFAGPVDFNDAAWTYAAETMLEWQERGYFSSDATSTKATEMLNAFTTGTSPMMVSGSWFDGQLTAATGLDWGEFLFPGNTYTQGSGGNIWVVPTNSKQQELAYEFIDLTLQEPTQNVLANSGGVAVASDLEAIEGEHAKEAAANFAAISDADGLGYYADWPAPGYYDFQVKQLQQLLTGSVSVAEFNDSIAKFYEDYAVQIR